MKQKNGGPTLDGSATKRLIFELPFIAPYKECVASTRNLYVQIVWEFGCGKIWMLSSFLCEDAPQIMAFWTE